MTMLAARATVQVALPLTPHPPPPPVRAPGEKGSRSSYGDGDGGSNTFIPPTGRKRREASEGPLTRSTYDFHVATTQHRGMSTLHSSPSDASNPRNLPALASALPTPSLPEQGISRSLPRQTSSSVLSLAQPFDRLLKGVIQLRYFALRTPGAQESFPTLQL